MNLKKLLTVAVAAVGLAACQNTPVNNTQTTQSAENKVSVVTSFYPVYYLAKEIGGDDANVTQLIEGNVEPHDYEPSAKDIANITNANLFLYSSDHMETWVEKIRENVGSSKVAIKSASDNIEFLASDDDHDHEHDHEHESDNDGHDDNTDSDDHHNHDHTVDPHIWLDPTLAKTMVENIANAFIQVDPDNKANYEMRRNQLLEKLDQLVSSYDSLKNATNKTFIVQHAAFGYIANRYGLDQIAVTGLTNEEPSASDITEAIEEVRFHNLTAIYVEASQAQSISDVISRQTGVSIEKLYTMEMAVEGMDYLQLLQANLESLQKTIK